MFRFTIRDVLWLMVVAMGFALLTMAKTTSHATMEGNAFAVAVALGTMIGAIKIVRNAQARR